MWQLPPVVGQTFVRNSLRLVMWQLRFHPILKLGSRVADFQERVRARFPGYEEIEATRVDVALQSTVAGLQVLNQKERNFLFKSADGTTIVSLSNAAVGISERAHVDRSRLASDIALAIEALGTVAGVVLGTRIGLRYVNLIDREHIGNTLGRVVAWDELIEASFLRFPLATQDDDTHFYCEATSSPGDGKMTVRYGILPEPGGAPAFRLDVDRFVEGEVAPDQIAGLVQTFARDIFAVFASAAGPALLEWMRGDV